MLPKRDRTAHGRAKPVPISMPPDRMPILSWLVAAWR